MLLEKTVFQKKQNNNNNNNNKKKQTKKKQKQKNNNNNNNKKQQQNITVFKQAKPIYLGNTSYRIRPNYRTVRLGFSKLLENF